VIHKLHATSFISIWKGETKFGGRVISKNEPELLYWWNDEYNNEQVRLYATWEAGNYGRTWGSIVFFALSAPGSLDSSLRLFSLYLPRCLHLCFMRSSIISFETKISLALKSTEKRFVIRLSKISTLAVCTTPRRCS
jgi:hypothetical protein